MSWTLLIGLVLTLAVALAATAARRAELARMQKRVRERERAVRSGSAKAQLQHPVIDLSRCLGCGACVRVCPEEGVLELVHGQAVVVNGARCTGVSACERECPVGAITVTLTNLEERRDIPVLNTELEAVGTPGLFLAGEVTAHALIKTAIEQGAAVATEVHRRVQANARADDGIVDLCIVGAGPAGLSCALEAKRRGLSFVMFDQESAPGGTVAKYPRRKLVMTQPVDLPLFGRLARSTYTKEELIDIWHGIVEKQALPFNGGVTFEGVDRGDDGVFSVRTSSGVQRAHHVCLALGRRGTPRKLDVAGEELPKVAYSLIDASSYQRRKILVVGGGDSAVEAALGLADQPGNEVTLSYRQEAFHRIRARNEERLNAAVARRTLRVALKSRVVAIGRDSVELEMENGAQSTRTHVPNDEVFVMAGGILPLETLERSGVSFDPKLRPASDPITEQGTGLTRALSIGLLLALITLGWALWHSDYYTLSPENRPVSAKHAELRPGENLGLALGIAASVLIIFNLAYLLRRAQRFGLKLGSLRAWMTSHVATGILALLCATLHGGMEARNTVGGHALWALLALFVTGAIGRYFYACVPRAANGRELELDEVRRRLSRLAENWDHSQREFVARVQQRVEALVEARQWRSSFFGRLLGLISGERDLRRMLASIEHDGRVESMPADRVRETLVLARAAYRTGTMAAHYEDLRALLDSWRYLHRWVAALMLLLLALHIAYALGYGAAVHAGGGG